MMDSFGEGPRVAWGRIVRVRLNHKRPPMTDITKSKKTKFPNVFAMPTGGHLVRARVVDPVDGKQREIKKVLPLDALQAHQWLQSEIARIKSGKPLPQAAKLRFSEFAESLLEEKLAKGEIRSAKGKERWGYTLVHLLEGTNGEKAEKHVPAFGDMFVDKIHVSHVEQWKLGIAGLIAAGDYSPVTVNGWLSILRVVAKAAARKFELSRSFAEGVEDFDTSEHVTYTVEEPNALLPEQVPTFLGAMRELYPQHYAMAFLGFATGLRPSMLRPLRRKGPNPDVLWEQKRILIRRSETKGEVMNKTKSGARYPIDLPKDVMDVLTWHAETQLSTPEQQESDLLFPSITGGFRAACVLNKPFADVCGRLGLPLLTQRGLRRTFQDLTRAAKVDILIKKSISGHATGGMDELYSAVSPAEQRESIAKVIQLFGSGGATSEAVTDASGNLCGNLTDESGTQKEKTG